MAVNRPHEIEAQGTALWVDNLSRDVLEQIRNAGVDVDEITLRQLADEGVKAFAGSFEALIDTIDGKITEMARQVR